MARIRRNRPPDGQLAEDQTGQEAMTDGHQVKRTGGGGRMTAVAASETKQTDIPRPRPNFA